MCGRQPVGGQTRNIDTALERRGGKRQQAADLRHLQGQVVLPVYFLVQLHVPQPAENEFTVKTSLAVAVSAVWIAGGQPGDAPHETQRSVLVVESSAEHDGVEKPELEGWQRFERDDLSRQPRPRVESIVVELPQKGRGPKRSEIAQEKRQMGGVDVLNAQRREGLCIIALGERGEVSRSPPRLLLPPRNRRVARTDHHLAP